MPTDDHMVVRLPTRVVGRIYWLAVAMVRRPDGKRIANVRLALQWLTRKATSPTVRARSYGYKFVSAQEWTSPEIVDYLSRL